MAQLHLTGCGGDAPRLCTLHPAIVALTKGKKTKPSPSQSVRRPITERRSDAASWEWKREEGTVRAGFQSNGCDKDAASGVGFRSGTGRLHWLAVWLTVSSLRHRRRRCSVLSPRPSSHSHARTHPPPHSASHTQRTTAHTRSCSPCRLRSGRSASVGRQLAPLPSPSAMSSASQLEMAAVQAMRDLAKLPENCRCADCDAKGTRDHWTDGRTDAGCTAGCWLLLLLLRHQPTRSTSHLCMLSSIRLPYTLCHLAHPIPLRLSLHRRGRPVRCAPRIFLLAVAPTRPPPPFLPLADPDWTSINLGIFICIKVRSNDWLDSG